MDRISLAKYFAGRIENVAYGAGKLKPGGVNARNDGALSKQELGAAINSGKLSDAEKNVALYLGKNFNSSDKFTFYKNPNGSGQLSKPGADQKLAHSELASGMFVKALLSAIKEIQKALGIA